MGYELDFNKIKESYGIKDNKIGLRHKTGKSIKLLPYTITKIKKDSRPNFTNSLGAFSRRVISKTLDSPLDTEEYLCCIIDNISEIQEKTLFKSIVKEMFFNPDGNIEVFHPKVLSYLYTENVFDKKLGIFLYDILINGDEETYSAVEKIYQKEPKNVLLRLMFSGLRELKDDKYVDDQYYNCLSEIRSMFKEDFLFIVRDKKVYIESIEKMLKFYYFMYISQIGFIFKKFLDEADENIEKIYFTLDWESTSRTRVGYIEGWNKVDTALSGLFSHINCLEILNHNNLDYKITYRDLKSIIDDMNVCDKTNCIQSLDTVIELYKANLGDVDWDNLNLSNKYNENLLYKKIWELYSTIEYQFNVSKRKDLHNNYRNWFTEFCKDNFLKSRGRLGFTLSMTEDYLLFMTKIIIKDNDKMKLKDFFKEFERRGVNFDRDTSKNIVALFDKLNILEKKSDSGDAQYVKRIL